MNKLILVVDDEEAIRKSFALALEDTDYKVDTVVSGEKGIESVTNQTYDLIFLDLKMPGLNGVETLQKIREIDNQVTVYFVTAFYGEFLEELEMAQKEGLCFEILKKPVGMDEIEMIAKGVLEGSMEIHE